MRALLLLAIFLSGSILAEDSFSTFPPMEHFYHPVSTKNPEAQKAFNRGLLALYAFNYDAALLGFDEASQLDPELAMAYWGMAMAIDANLDEKVRPIHAKLTIFLLKKAQERAKNATPNEQAYIQALEKRFSEDPEADRGALRKEYSKAMEEVHTAYPDDPDAGTLYAESLMDNLYWELWQLDGKPKEGTVKIIETLESVLLTNPQHLGANHYYIHAVEFSPHPECGLMAANRIDIQNPTDWGHLLHTTSHIYLRVGDFEKSRQANLRGIHADLTYIQKYGIEGKYPVHFLSHNYFFLTVATMWQECSHDAIQAAQNLAQFIAPHVADIPDFETGMTMPLQVYLYYHQWEEILAYPEVAQELHFTNCFRTFARAMAFTNLGKIQEAEKEKELFLKQKAPYLGPDHFLEIADHLLTATLAKAKGDFKKSEEFYKKAIAAQDLVNFTIWYQPVRQNLGRLLIELGRGKEAEIIFREAQKHLALHPRTLYGLSRALEAQGKSAYWLERELKQALKYCGKKLDLSDL